MPSNEIETVNDNHINEKTIISNDDATECNVRKKESFVSENQNHIQYTNAIIENNDHDSNLDGINTDEENVESSSVIVVDEKHIQSQTL